LLGFFFCIKATVKLTHSSNHTEHYRKCAISHARNKTALQPDIHSTHLLLVRNKER